MDKTEAESEAVAYENICEQVDFSKIPGGLAPAVVQDADTREVLMLAYMNEEALSKTLDTGCATFWTRSREKLWTKGEQSGNFMRVRRVSVDCDGDTILLEVEPQGDKKACHTGEVSCFYRGFDI